MKALTRLSVFYFIVHRSAFILSLSPATVRRLRLIRGSVGQTCPNVCVALKMPVPVRLPSQSVCVGAGGGLKEIS
jgi:hypothetical protein